VALVGASGAGKSTVAALLLRFREPTAGDLMIDGKPIASFPLTAYRNRLAYVPQEVILFGGDIRENIGYGRPGASDAEIEDAARRAHALDFIRGFPEGFGTRVGERGVQLSGGQRQRIAIARAILRNPDLLVLDEATSALDTASEFEVQAALHELMRGRTSLVIAHRLSTVRAADRIAVLEAGKVVEVGSHEALMEADGAYRKLVERQEFVA
jgi:ABC-type multidrug transport system fused ATPase/permease subunit